MTRVCWALVGGAVVISALAIAQDGPESARRGTKRFETSVVVSGLAGPWEVTWGPDDMLWVTERTGKRVTRVNPVTGARTVAVTIDEASAPGGQDGVLGMALHPQLLDGSGSDFVYVYYTYVDQARGPDLRVADPASPYRFLYGKVVRMRFDASRGSLVEPVDLITGLPAGNDHNAGRLRMAPDGTLHLTIGDMGNGQFGNACNPILSQRLPTRDEVASRDWSAYEGKTLRLGSDGSIPADNPELNGVVSHVYTYGHRNPQGIAFGPDGTLYATDHGPKTDDEVNVLTKGGNYGWPHVAGMRDDKAYEHAGWADSSVPCPSLRFSDLAIPPSVPRVAETAFPEPIVEPIATLFTVPTGFNFEDPACKGVHFLCWPTVGISSVTYYGGGEGGIPGWDGVLLVTTLKRGSLYVVPLDATRQQRSGSISRYLQSVNRYRDIALAPDGRTFYVATDASGLVEDLGGGATSELEHRGAILAFTYVGEGDGSPADTRDASPTGRDASPTGRDASPRRPVDDRPLTTSIPPVGPEAPTAAEPRPVMTGPGVPPTFTTAQVASGKTSYDTYCAVCHGSTLTNGTFGTPLAGEYFRTHWSGRSVELLYEKSRSTMPPAAPDSLTPEAYANIVAYMLEVNGVAAGDVALPVEGDRRARMRIP